MFPDRFQFQVFELFRRDPGNGLGLFILGLYFPYPGFGLVNMPVMAFYSLGAFVPIHEFLDQFMDLLGLETGLLFYFPLSGSFRPFALVYVSGRTSPAVRVVLAVKHQYLPFLIFYNYPDTLVHGILFILFGLH